MPVGQEVDDDVDDDGDEDEDEDEDEVGCQSAVQEFRQVAGNRGSIADRQPFVSNFAPTTGHKT